MLFGMQENDDLHKDVMIKGRGCPEIGCAETYAHCYRLKSRPVLVCYPHTIG